MDTERKVSADKEMREWCVALPKVELHAHLNGSVRNSTLLSVPPAAAPVSGSWFLPLVRVVPPGSMSIMILWQVRERNLLGNWWLESDLVYQRTNLISCTEIRILSVLQTVRL